MKPRTVLIPLSKGMIVEVCECHYSLVKDYKWHCTGMGYAARSQWSPRQMIYLHRIVAGTPKGMGTDHKDGNKMNCTCWNLRIVEQRHNVYNSGLSRRSSTGYKGVSFMKSSKTYRAYISSGSIQRHLGCFKTAEAAAIAYNEAAIKQWGAYARLNIVAKPKT